MSLRRSSTLKAATLGGLALMFYAKISSGTLGYYINARFYWLPYVALILLMAFALTLVYGSMRPNKPANASSPQALLGEGAIPIPIDEPHTHQHPWWVLALIGVPVLLGLLLPARALSASALGSRGLGTAAPARVAGAPLTAPFGEEGKTILDWLRDFSRAGGDLSTFEGAPADVTGFVYRDKRTTGDAFWVARYTLSCCVADASGIGMVAKWPQAGSLVEGSWVRVRGAIGISNLENPGLPVIVASSVEPVEQPGNPYLLP